MNLYIRMPKYLFFDTNPAIIDELRKKFDSRSATVINKLKDKFGTEVLYAVGDIRELTAETEIDVIVSPANSFGYMDGGIDKVYSQMFPNVQKCVQDKINKVGVPNASDKKYLPIGSAVFVRYTGQSTSDNQFAGQSAPFEQSAYFICAPTMYLPQSIKGTMNVYYAMLAILRLTQDWSPNVIIAIPGLGTGVGEINAQNHADQVYQAYSDFAHGNADHPCQYDKKSSYYVLKSHACKQRNLYCNVSSNKVENTF